MYAWAKINVIGCLAGKCRPLHVCLLGLIAQSQDEKGVATLAYSEIAQRLRIGRRTAIKLVRELVEAKWIHKNVDYSVAGSPVLITSVLAGASVGRSDPLMPSNGKPAPAKRKRGRPKKGVK